MENVREMEGGGTSVIRMWKRWKAEMENDGDGGSIGSKTVKAIRVKEWSGDEKGKI